MSNIGGVQISLPQAEDPVIDNEPQGAPDADPELAEWFKVDDVEKAPSQKPDESETESDADSDNQDLRPDDDDWVTVGDETGPAAGQEVSMDK